MWTMRNQQPINIRNERLEGISLTHNLEEERTPRSVCMHLYLINLYFFLIGATLVG